MNVLVFDIETVPDTVTGSRLYGLEGLDDDSIAKAMFTKRLQKTGGSDFLPLHLHKVVAISAVLRSGNQIKVWSLGTETSSEKELITRFYDGIDRFSPTLVSWNGGGFDLPVLHYRSLVHGIDARRYWDNGEDDREFKFNNYLSRYHWRHTDLMDILASFNLRAAAPLDEVAMMLGFPGKLGMNGGAVWDTFLEGNVKAIRDYCETDVLNTYLVFLRWELVRGNLNQQSYDQECRLVRTWLTEANQGHFNQFLEEWQYVSEVDDNNDGE
ncbi:MAG: 3'-5' exonuclease [Gammaproteobacteria bacterium]|nr:3'-5' exonuclease [Gammaproteobacteria bacterium]